ncbi:hypothetical protein [Acinetobacter guerrae]|uniref:hypothetical protein n=1 Tax=Acinetobacter guerrae TaxID=1843371 RepID=UPI0021CC76D5|nr:hypothetical protein [Acinetobacter guerrae]
MFKVGDLVVFKGLPYDRLFRVHKKGGDSIVLHECWDEAGAKCFCEDYPYSDIRLATTEEIAAGHRIDKCEVLDMADVSGNWEVINETH